MLTSWLGCTRDREAYFRAILVNSKPKDIEYQCEIPFGIGFVAADKTEIEMILRTTYESLQYVTIDVKDIYVWPGPDKPIAVVYRTQLYDFSFVKDITGRWLLAKIVPSPQP